MNNPKIRRYKILLASAVTLTAVSVAGCMGIGYWFVDNDYEHIDIIAHRGASGHAPENTLAAFEKAVEMESDWFELDCRLSKDEEVVIVHDADLERTTGQKLRVADLTVAELKGYDVGSWFDAAFKGEPIPTLRESLEVATRACGVYVEIKAETGDNEASMALIQRALSEAALTEPLRRELIELADASGCRSVALTRGCIEDIRAMRMEKRVVIQSFSPLICFVALGEAPEIRTEFLLSDDKDHPERWQTLVDFALWMNVAGINVKKDDLTQERIDAFQAAGKTVAVYTVNEASEITNFAEMGVDAVITNFPDVAWRELRAIY